MLQRSVHSIQPTQLKHFGNLETRSALGELNENRTDPFLVLSHHGPQRFKPNNTGMPFSDHPHSGFETVTFVFEGSVVHSDSGGHHSKVDKGGVQWMTAGAGVIHNEQVPPEFMKDGGVLEISQLWINLPSNLKMTPPRYTGAQASAIPSIPLAGSGGTLHLVSGSYGSAHGPIDSLTDIFMSSVDLDKDAQVVLPAPSSKTVLLYVVSGDVSVHGRAAKLGDLISFEDDGDCVFLQSSAGARLIYAYGEPIAEPVVSYGPFVMSSNEGITQTLRAYQSGSFDKPPVMSELG